MASHALDLARLEWGLVRVDMFACGRWRLEVNYSEISESSFL